VGTVRDEVLWCLRYQGLRVALKGRDENALEPLLAFLARNISHPDYSDQLTDVTAMVLGMWWGNCDVVDKGVL
jgi:hypothetical protein